MAKAVKLVKTAPSEVKMMHGTSGKLDYFCFARKGNVALGIKPEGASPGERFGVPDTVYFAARLRSAQAGNLFAEEDAKQKVVKLQTQPANVWDAWPDVTWINKNAERASTTIGVFIKGQFNPNKPGMLQTLLDNIGEGKLAKQMAEYLIGLAGDAAIVTVDELTTALDKVFEPQIKSILEAIEKLKLVQDAFAESVGNFGMQAQLLKKIYDAKKGESEPEDDGHGHAIDPEDDAENDD
jgi:hypothetical protein